MIVALDHVQLAMPAGGEELARHFYIGLLGFSEVRKPANLMARGGCWFETGAVKLHLGVEKCFQPALKAHPALLVDDLSTLITALSAGGYRTSVAEPLSGFDRVYVSDPFGNRIELMQQRK